MCSCCLVGKRAAWEVQDVGKIAGRNTAEPSEPGALSTGEVRGVRGVAVICIDITQKPTGEGSVPAGH